MSTTLPPTSSPPPQPSPPPQLPPLPTPPPVTPPSDPPPPPQRPSGPPPPPQLPSGPPPPPQQSSDPPPPPQQPSDPPPPPQQPSDPPPPPQQPNDPPPPPQQPNDPPPSESPPPPGRPTNSPPPLSPNPPTTSPPPPSTTPNSTSPAVPSRSPPPSNSPPTTLTPPSFVPPSYSPPTSSRVPPPSNSTPDTSQSPSNRNHDHVPILAIVLVVVFVFLGALGMLANFVWKKKKRGSGQNGGHIMPSNVVSTESDAGMLKVQVSPPNNPSGSANGIPYSPREAGGMGYSRSLFTYDELLEATNGFSAQNLLGEGGFGSVYKGILTDGRIVAVKQLKIGGGQGEREFRAEVDIISRIHHRHLVSLVGYCISDDNRLLVYEYVANDTLYFHLHGEGRPVLDWSTRVKIAIGSARGLAYLHEDCHPRVIHRDIKSSNILLDTNFKARVADFGLAKLAMDANTHVTTRVMGTFGYMAPEYASSGKLTEKSDVYSFGVVLLELITGRKSVDTSQRLGEESLVEWARPLLSNALETGEFGILADPKLHGNYVGGEMFLMIQAAAACVRHSSSKRPKMGQVVRAFDSMVASDLTNGMRVGDSRIYNSAQQSAEIRLFQRMAFGSQEYSTDFFGQSSFGESDRANSQRN